jgi:hypothetical protein
MLRLTLCALLLLAASVASTHRPVRTYTLDLDQAPQHRYDHIVKDTANGFNTTVWSFYNKYFANDKVRQHCGCFSVRKWGRGARSCP